MFFGREIGRTDEERGGWASLKPRSMMLCRWDAGIGGRGRAAYPIWLDGCERWEGRLWGAGWRREELKWWRGV